MFISVLFAKACKCKLNKMQSFKLTIQHSYNLHLYVFGLVITLCTFPRIPKIQCRLIAIQNLNH